MRSVSLRTSRVFQLGLSTLLAVVVSVALWPTAVTPTVFSARPSSTEATTSATTNGIDVLLVGVAVVAILLWLRFRR